MGPASDPASASPTSHLPSILLKGGGSTEKEGGTSRGGAAASSGGRRVAFVDGVGRDNGRHDHPTASPPATFAAAAGGLNPGGSGGPRPGFVVNGSAQPGTAHTPIPTAASSSSSSPSVSGGKRGRTALRTGPPTATSSSTSGGRSTKSPASTATAARRISISKKGKKRQRGPVYAKNGDVLPNRNGKATGHPGLPDPAESLSASDDTGGWTREGLKKHGDTLPETKGEEEEFYAMAIKESRADGSIPPPPSSLPVPAFFTAVPSVDSPTVPSVDSPTVPSEVHQSHQTADFPPLPAAPSTSAMGGNDLAISNSKKNGLSNLSRSASRILHPPARKRSSSGTSSEAANATE